MGDHSRLSISVFTWRGCPRTATRATDRVEGTTVSYLHEEPNLEIQCVVVSSRTGAVASGSSNDVHNDIAEDTDQLEEETDNADGDDGDQARHLSA